MSKAFFKLSSIIDKTNTFFGRLAGWLCLVLILITVQQVLARYFFKGGSVAIQELEWHLFAAIFILATAWTYKENGHVRVDLFYAKLSEKGKAIINCIGIVFFLFPICYVIVFFGIEQVEMALSYTNHRPVDYYSISLYPEKDGMYQSLASFEAFLRKTILVGEISPEAGGLEARWLIKSIIPFGFALLALQGLSELIKNTMKVFGVQAKP